MLKGWIIASYDASTAYCAKQWYLQVVDPSPPSSTSSSKSPPGHALERPWQHLWKKILLEVGGSSFHVMLKNVAGVFPSLNLLSFSCMMWIVLVGIMGSHVDDLITRGYGPKYDSVMKTFTEKLHLKHKDGEVRFCGKNLVQGDDKSISLG